MLVIGASTGYGLASRINAAFGSGAATIGVFFEKHGSEGKTGSAGWYNSAGFDKAAKEEGLYAKSINGDAFSNECRQTVIDLIKKDWVRLTRWFTRWLRRCVRCRKPAKWCVPH